MLKKLTTVAAGLGTIATAVGLAVGVAAPAQAVIVSTDPVRITEPQLDFGGSPWVLGAPTNSGVLGWDVGGGDTTAILSGYLYINNAAGTCARMRLETYDINHAFIDSTDGGTVCAGSGALHSWRVNFAADGDPDVTHVHVMLQVQTAGGGYTTVGTEYEDL